MALACRYEHHAGIVLASHSSWRLSSLIHALDRLLSGTQAEDWIGQVRWLNEWTKPKEDDMRGAARSSWTSRVGIQEQEPVGGRSRESSSDEFL
jgi:hypothetical protein